MKPNVLLVAIVSFTIGCSSINVRTDAKSYKDPQCTQKQIKTIIVYADSNDLQYSDFIESSIVKYLQKYYECSAVKRLDIIIPTRKYTENEIKNILMQNSIDAILSFTVQDSGYNKMELTLNQSYQTYGNIYNRGGGMYSYDMQTYGGPQKYDVYKPFLNARAELYDIVTEKKLWVVQLNSYGNAFAVIDDTLIDAIKTTVKKLEEDGMIRRKSKKQ